VIALALLVWAVGCGVTPGPVALLTGGDDQECSIGTSIPMRISGDLVADRIAGTAIQVDPVAGWGSLDGTRVPVRWPDGYTGWRLSTGEVEVRGRTGNVVVTTGRHVELFTQWDANSTDGGFPTCGWVPT